MKIVISSQGDSADSPLDKRFGRAFKFIVYDLGKDLYTPIGNEQSYVSPQGAGIQAAQTVINTGAAAVITGHVGPKAFRTLNSANIKIYTAADMTVKEAVAQYKKGILKEAKTNNVDGHWI